MTIESITSRRAFWANLARDFSYETQSGETIWSARHMPWLASLKYHLGVFHAIRTASRLALAGNFTSVSQAECCYSIVKVAERCGCVFRVKGLENLDGNLPAVFVSNHMASLETLVLSTFIAPFSDVTFILKRSLMTYPVFGDVIKGIRPVAISRSNPRDDLKDVLVQGVARLRSGVSMVVFPQATRSPVFDRKAFNSLGVKLAAKAGVPVIPLAVKTDFIPRGRIHKDFGIVDATKPALFQFGPPVRIAGNGRQEHEQITRYIVDRMQEWGVPVI